MGGFNSDQTAAAVVGVFPERALYVAIPCSHPTMDTAIRVAVSHRAELWAYEVPISLTYHVAA